MLSWQTVVLLVMGPIALQCFIVFINRGAVPIPIPEPDPGESS